MFAATPARLSHLKLDGMSPGSLILFCPKCDFQYDGAMLPICPVCPAATTLQLITVTPELERLARRAAYPELISVRATP